MGPDMTDQVIDLMAALKESLAKPRPTPVAELVAECRRRETTAREDAADSARYAAWQRSPEGLANRSHWVGDGPESGEADAAAMLEEAEFFADLAREIERLQGVVDRAVEKLGAV